MVQEEHCNVDTSYQLLGRRTVGASFLADELSFGCHQATHHDRRFGEPKVPSLARCCESCRKGEWMEGLLARLRSVLLARFSGKCNGVGRIRRCYEDALIVRRTLRGKRGIDPRSTKNRVGLKRAANNGTFKSSGSRTHYGWAILYRDNRVFE